jgi:UDP-N-acetylmuramoylalanine--D-glutamate ligase
VSVEATLARIAPGTTDLRGRRVLVVGLGRSGLGAARFAVGRGARVTVTDARDEAALGAAATEVRTLGVELLAGGSPVELAERADVVVVSPGVPPGLPVLERARERGLPVWSEIELAARHATGRVVGITGSNGKSTVTTMVARMLETAGLPHTSGGNLGTPWTDLLAADTPETIHVLELSSFQLEATSSLAADVAVVLNLTPDHLDRYASLDEYAAAKARLLELQEPGSPAVLNADDPRGERFARVAQGPVRWFATRDTARAHAFLAGDGLVMRDDDGERVVLRRSELPLAGDHNVANALAALLAATLAGCPPDRAADALRGYRALPHRLERVLSKGGVTYYDDSKATNPDSTAVALDAFPGARVHLILGGRDKGGDWGPVLARLGRGNVRVLLVGEAEPLLRRLVGDRAATVSCGTIERAVRAAAAVAGPGDVVILAPGCASFDQYTDYTARGRDFARHVRALAGGDDRG